MVVYTAIRGGKNMKKGKKLNFKQGLTYDENVRIGYGLAKFEVGEINYKTFEVLMNDIGISVNPIFTEVDTKIENTDYEPVNRVMD